MRIHTPARDRQNFNNFNNFNKKWAHTSTHPEKSENEILLYIYINIFIYIYNRPYFNTFTCACPFLGEIIEIIEIAKSQNSEL